MTATEVFRPQMPKLPLLQFNRIKFAECEASILPVYRRTDLQKHKKISTGIWVSYQDGVYDITEFIKVHPGGSDKLMMAAGGAIDPFWEMYPFHKVDTVRSLLAKYKIGQLHPDD